MPQVDIAKLLRIAPHTLRKHYRAELDESMAMANADVAGWLYDNAASGNVAAQIFWCKTRLGWSEKNRLELTGADGDAVRLDNTIRIEVVEPAHEDLGEIEQGEDDDA